MLPIITSINTNEGSLKGNELVVNGSGFGIEKKIVQVFVGGKNCELKELDKYSIKCSLKEGATATPASNVGGQGV